MAEGQEHSKYYGRLAKVGLVWGILRIGAATLVLIATSAVLARLLLPEDFGVAAAVFFFTQLAARLASLGVGVSLGRLKHVTDEHEASVFVISLTTGAVTWLVLSGGAGMIGRFFGSPDAAAVLPIAAVSFLVLPFGVVPMALLDREMRFRQGTMPEWMGIAANAAVSIALAWQGSGFWSLVYGRLADDTVRTLGLLWISGWIPKWTFSRAAMKEIVGFGLGVQAKNLLDYAAQNLDSVIIGRMLGMGALGFYDKAVSTLKRLLVSINVSGPGVSFRIFALIHEDPARFRRAYRKVILSITMLGYPILAGGIVAAPELVRTLFGPQWTSSVLPFQILCVVGMLKLTNMYASVATQATGQVWGEVKRQVVHVVLLVAFVGICSRWGIAGAAVGVLLATGVMTVLIHTLVRRFTPLEWSDLVGSQVPALVSAAGLIAVLLVTRAGVRLLFGPVPAWALLLVSVGAGALYYVLAVLFSPYSEVRGVVRETVQDLAPAMAKRMTWLIGTGELPALSRR